MYMTQLTALRLRKHSKSCLLLWMGSESSIMSSVYHDIFMEKLVLSIEDFLSFYTMHKGKIFLGDGMWGSRKLTLFLITFFMMLSYEMMLIVEWSDIIFYIQPNLRSFVETVLDNFSFLGGSAFCLWNLSSVRFIFFQKIIT